MPPPNPGLIALLGYWPRSLFGSTGFATYAHRISFGGEVYDHTGTYHTKTDMGGDGAHASAGFGHAAFQKQMRYYTYTGGTAYWWRLSTATGPIVVDVFNWNCYSITANWSSHPNWEDYIFFGGPGYNLNQCRY